MKALRTLLVAVFALSLSHATLAQEAAKPAEPPKPTVTPYGFILLNSFWNANTFSSPDYPSQAAKTQAGGAFLMSARQSRFGVKLAMNDDNWTGAALTGTIEFDFKGGHFATNSNGFNAGIMRLRLASAVATFKTGYGTWALLAGQDYGLVNPLFATSVAWVADPIFWQAGNAWRRSPQIRATYSNSFGAANVSVAAAMLSPADADAGVGGTTTVTNGAGIRSRQPDIEARAALGAKLDGGISGTLGVGYHTNKRRYNGATAPDVVDVTATIMGVDLDVNVPYLNLRGEWFDSSGADETYNGIAASGVRAGATAGTYEKVESSGYWAQAVLKPLDKIWVTVGVGSTKLDNLAATTAATVRKENSQVEGGVILNAGKYWKVGLEVCQTTTKYFDDVKQDAMQIALSSQLTF
ncbi:MAG: hypothetical protein IPQ24_01385 [Anaeromyxobacter sp.]|nr:hypothetical protein [Anaeromyxobacter sp.]